MCTMHDQLQTNGGMPEGEARGQNLGFLKISFDGGCGGPFMESGTCTTKRRPKLAFKTDYR